READSSNTRGVRHREVIPRPDRHLVADFDLPAQVHEKRPVGYRADPDAGHAPQPGDDLLRVDTVTRLDGDVALGPLSRGLDQVDGADISAGVADRGRDPAEHARSARDLQPDCEAVAGARGDHWDDSTPAGAPGPALPWTARDFSRNSGWGRCVNH